MRFREVTYLLGAGIQRSNTPLCDLTSFMDFLRVSHFGVCEHFVPAPVQYLLTSHSLALLRYLPIVMVSRSSTVGRYLYSRYGIQRRLQIFDRVSQQRQLQQQVCPNRIVSQLDQLPYRSCKYGTVITSCFICTPFLKEKKATLLAGTGTRVPYWYGYGRYDLPLSLHSLTVKQRATQR